MVYDAESGLVYTETVVSALKAQPYNDFATSASGSKPKYQPLRRGAHPMKELITRKLLCKLDRLDASSLSTVPAVIIEALWEKIKTAKLNSLQVWQVFAQTHLGKKSFAGSHRFPFSIHRVPAIIDYTAGSSRWLVSLSLGGALASQLVYVSKLDNLRFLHVYTGLCPRKDRANFESSDDCSDTMIRSWADAAVQDGAFSKLQMAFFQGYSHVTNGTLFYLHCFPALDTFCTYECGMKGRTLALDETRTLGWNLTQKGLATGFTWSDIVNWSITRFESSLVQEDQKPLLAIQVGLDCKRSASKKFSDIHCFERDWTAQLDSVKREPGDAASEPVSKRRKISGGKTQALEDVLATF